MRGHVRQRGKTWSVVYYRGRKPNGKADYKWKGGYRTEKDAERALTKILQSMDDGTYVEPTRQTVAAFLTDWLPTLEVRGLRPSTRGSYGIMIDTQIVPRIGSVPLQKLSAAHLNAMYAEMLASGRIQREGGLSARTVRYAHTIIRKALSDAVKWNLLVRNPGDAADPPSAKAAKAREMKTWSAEELGLFLREVAEDRLFAAFRLVAMTGMRRGEVLGLRWRDVDLVTGRAAITQTIIAPRYVTQLSTPKTDKGRRSVELDAGTVDVLRAHKKRQAEERLAFGPGYEDNDLAFCREDGSPLKPHLFSLAFETRAKRAGLPKIRLHDLRHTHATLALKGDEPAKVVSERLGHSSVAITLDIYSHADPGLQKGLADRLAAMVDGP